MTRHKADSRPLVLLLTREVAERKGVTVKTVNEWARQGHLPVAHVEPISGARMFDAIVVDAFDPKEFWAEKAKRQILHGPDKK
jgi:hypothetical protein